MTVERWRDRRRRASLRYRVSLVDGDTSVLAPGTAIIETRYRGKNATWSMVAEDGTVTRAGGHFDPVVMRDEPEHDPATCPECLAAAAEEPAERLAARAG